eukprot:CAMPEP_0177729136 /NCGR_PEP_ID=MMETSP0484_2-20121128/21259_1 /TAXON_ID=354590 /ORGANISM="Rhodomonas lens, Strain RHODO" /LENGTH=254 /DNA_ID=CAMNT_0019241967 /DNA_START=91 /DNA_END=853 /DNA_ORIENTATION=+
MKSAVTSYSGRVHSALVSWRKSFRGTMPWGFESRDLEHQYLAYYWLTFATNNKQILTAVYAFATLWVASCSAWHCATAGLVWTMFVDFLLFLTASGCTYLFSQPHLPHWFKSFFTWGFKMSMWVVPVATVVRGCSRDTPPNFLAVQQLQLVAIGGWTCPHWTHHTINLFSCCFIPLAWRAAYTDADLEDLVSTTLLVFIVGSTFNGVLCVERRNQWLEQFPKTLAAPDLDLDLAQPAPRSVVARRLQSLQAGDH